MPSDHNKPIEYLTIGPLTRDVVGTGYTLGGTAAYASLTARAFGLKAAIATSCSPQLDFSTLNGIEVYRRISTYDTTFENIQTPQGRKQILNAIADTIRAADIPKEAQNAQIAHIGPLANEVDPEVIAQFHSDTLIGITPQGWMRERGEDGYVRYHPWLPTQAIIQRADAVVISDEDVHKDEATIQEYANLFRLLVVTEGFNGARVYWHGDARHFSAPKLDVADPTGAGDIFAAVFFIRLKATRDPWEAATTAVSLASLSVTRRGLESIPTPEEVQSNLMKIIKGTSSQ